MIRIAIVLALFCDAAAAHAQAPSGDARSSAAASQPSTDGGDGRARLELDAAVAFDDFRTFSLDASGSRSSPEYTERLLTALGAGTTRVTSIVERYFQVLRFVGPRWHVAAMLRAARVWEIFAAGLRAGAPQPVFLPLHEAARAQQQMERLIRERAMSAECSAILRYVDALRIARATAVSTPEVADAWARMQQYGEARVRACQSQDGTSVTALRDLDPSRAN